MKSNRLARKMVYLLLIASIPLSSAKTLLVLYDEISDAAVSSAMIQSSSGNGPLDTTTGLPPLGGPDLFNWGVPAIVLLVSLGEDAASTNKLARAAYATSSDFVSYHISRVISQHPGFETEIQQTARACIEVLPAAAKQHIASASLLDVAELMLRQETGRCSSVL